MEEAYELADAAQSGDDEKLLDELGDVLFQVYFLSLLLEERGKGDLAAVAEHCRLKLIRRHPHVFGEREAATAGDVVRNWNQIKRDDEQGGDPFGHLPETLPSTLYARRSSSARGARGHDWESAPATMPGDAPARGRAGGGRRGRRPGAEPARRRRQVQESTGGREEAG